MGISINGVSKMDGLFHEKCHLEMDDDWGIAYDSGNLHMLCHRMGWSMFETKFNVEQILGLVFDKRFFCQPCYVQFNQH